MKAKTLYKGLNDTIRLIESAPQDPRSIVEQYAILHHTLISLEVLDFHNFDNYMVCHNYICHVKKELEYAYLAVKSYEKEYFDNNYLLIRIALGAMLCGLEP